MAGGPVREGMQGRRPTPWIIEASTPETGLDIEFTLHVEGQESPGLELHWPLIGQVLAANQRTVDDLPA